MTPHTNQVVPVEPTPCPFCGSNNISCGEVLGEYPTGRTYSQSMCYQCKALGPEAELEEGEIDYGDVKANVAWNRRAAAPQQQGEPVAECVHQGQGMWVRILNYTPLTHGTKLFTQPLTADASFNQAMLWLYSHCVALGMDCKSESGKPEHDIALFVSQLKRPTDMVTMTRESVQQCIDTATRILRSGGDYGDDLTDIGLRKELTKARELLSRELEGK